MSRIDLKSIQRLLGVKSEEEIIERIELLQRIAKDHKKKSRQVRNLHAALKRKAITSISKSAFAAELTTELNDEKDSSLGLVSGCDETDWVRESARRDAKVDLLDSLIDRVRRWKKYKRVKHKKPLPPLRLKKMWATVDAKREFPYLDVFNSKSQAVSEIGKFEEHGLLIADVITGYCIVNETGMCIDESDNFYFTKDHAVMDLEKFLQLKKYKRGYFR